ncbi:unnamed protein product [Closterium sp. NIES-53]
MPGSGGTHRQVSPTRDLSGVRELVTPRVRQAAKAALGGVQAPALLTSAVAGTENVGAGTSTSTALTPSVPLTKLLGGGGLTTALLLLALTTTGATPLCKAATSSATASASSATSSASAPSATAATATAATAADNTSTSASTPTTTTTPSTASTSTAPATPTSAPAPLAPASAAAPARGRRSTDRLETTEVGRSSRSNRGQERGGGTPLKDRVTMSMFPQLPLIFCCPCCCILWTYRRCTRSSEATSAQWPLATCAEFQDVPRLCHLLSAVYKMRRVEPYFRGLINEDFVVRRANYEDTKGRCPPYMVYVDHEARDICLVVRGLKSSQIADYEILLDQKKGAEVSDAVPFGINNREGARGVGEHGFFPVDEEALLKGRTSLLSSSSPPLIPSISDCIAPLTLPFHLTLPLMRPYKPL